MGLDWERNRLRKIAQLAERQRQDDARYVQDLKRKHPLPTGPSKAQLRDELQRIMQAAKVDSRPWGPWSAWQEVIKPNGERYWERSCSKVARIGNTD